MADQQHCSHCTEGVLAEGTPQGYEGKICGGMDAYFAKKHEGTTSAIVIATDVFGQEFVNVRLIADSLTKHTGFMVVIPDIFNHGAMSPDLFDLPEEERQKRLNEFLKKQGYPDQKIPILRSVIHELTNKKGIDKVGVLGFCYGGRISAVLASEDQTVAHVICHPAPLKVPEEIETIKHPTLWICAETDPTFPKADRDKAEEVLKNKGSTRYTFRDFPGTVHGFACRGDPKDAKVQQAKLDALQAMIDFFNKELA